MARTKVRLLPVNFHQEVGIEDFRNTIERLSLLEHRGQLTRKAMRVAVRELQAINERESARGRQPLSVI